MLETFLDYCSETFLPRDKVRGLAREGGVGVGTDPKNVAASHNITSGPEAKTAVTTCGFDGLF
jgi:hypothetical protein